MAGALSINQLYSKKRTLLAFDGEFAESFGLPELRGFWLIWGGSTNGKTTFALQLCRYLTQFKRVAYDSLEEGDSESFKLACQRVGMEEAKRRFIILNEPVEELKDRLRKHKAPEVVVIDSLQYSLMSYADCIALRTEFPETLFIVISHADGKEPEGKVAKGVRYDSFIKIRVEGYVAFPAGRYGGGKPFVINKQLAEKYHGVEFK